LNTKITFLKQNEALSQEYSANTLKKDKNGRLY